MSNTKCAVLMGDIIHSREAENTEVVHSLFNKEVNWTNSNERPHLLSPLTITLGDEFQGLVDNLQNAFQIAFLMRHSLMQQSIHCRFVTGCADISTKLNHKVAWNMMGKGLAEARSLLGKKEDVNCYRFSLPNDVKSEMLLNAIGLSLTAIESKWTLTQMNYVSKILLKANVSKMKIAKELEISANSLYSALRSADFHFYLELKQTIEDVLQIIDKESR